MCTRKRRDEPLEASEVVSMSSEELNANQLNISLKLDDCKMDDAGEITATAQNAAGEDACSAILKIKCTLKLIVIINTWIKILVILCFS